MAKDNNEELNNNPLAETFKILTNEFKVIYRLFYSLTKVLTDKGILTAAEIDYVLKGGIGEKGDNNGNQH